MVKVKAIYVREIRLSMPAQEIASRELEKFINSIGYEKVRQILVNGAPYTYTVIYEE